MVVWYHGTIVAGGVMVVGERRMDDGDVIVLGGDMKGLLLLKGERCIIGSFVVEYL